MGMEIKVTFRHLEHDEKLRAHAEEEIMKISRYLRRPLEAQVIFTREKSRCLVEVNLFGDAVRFFAKEEDVDLTLALKQTLAKLEAQVKKYRDRMVRSKGKRASEEEVAVGESTGEFEIVRSKEHLARKPITIEEAAEVLGNNQSHFIVFRNALNEKICVLFRKEDGNLGLIEPE